MATESSTKSTSDKSQNPPISFLSSDYDNLELAKAKAAESIINVNQCFLDIDTEIKVYSDKLSLLGDNSEDLNEDTLKFPDIQKEKKEESKIALFHTALGVNNETNLERDSAHVARIITSESGGGGLRLRSLPTMKQVLDTAASEHYKAGRISVKMGDWTKALTSFSRCIYLRPDEPSHFANRAEVYFQLTDLPAAIADYKHACILAPDNGATFHRLAFLHVFQGQIMFDQGRYSAALEAVCKAIEMFPDNQGYQIRAIVSMAALNRHTECLALVDKQIELDNTNPDFYVLRAKLHANFRNFSLSYYDLIDAIKLQPDHQEASDVLSQMTEQAVLLKYQAIEMALSNRLHEAIHKISLAIDLDPINGDYHVKRGSFYRRIKDFTGAIDDFLMAMDKTDHNESNPIYTEAQKQLVLTFNDFGVDCFHKNHLEESLLLLNKAINSTIMSEEPAFFMNRGDCFFRMSDWNFARNDYERASILRNGEYQFLAKTRMALVDFAKAREMFTTNNQYKKSEQLFNSAIEYNPTIPGFWLMRSRNRFILEDFRNSRIDFICFMLLSNETFSNNKDNESFFKRIFPNKSIQQVLESKLAKNAKTHLSITLKYHLKSLEIDINNNELNSNQLNRSNTKSTKVSNYRKEKVMDCMIDYEHVKDKINSCFDDRSFFKSIKSNGSIRRSSLADIIIPNDTNGHNHVCGIIGRQDGTKYFLETNGTVSAVKQPVGWRTFSGVINFN